MNGFDFSTGKLWTDVLQGHRLLSFWLVTWIQLFFFFFRPWLHLPAARFERQVNTGLSPVADSTDIHYHASSPSSSSSDNVKIPRSRCLTSPQPPNYEPFLNASLSLPVLINSSQLCYPFGQRHLHGSCKHIHTNNSLLKWGQCKN